LLEHIQDVKFVEEDEITFKVLPARIQKSAKRAFTYGTEYLKERWPEQTTNTVIWERSLFVEAEFEHNPASITNKAHVAARYYKDLAKEIIDND